LSHLAPSRAAELLASLAGRRLLVLGDLMLDEYLVGDVHRISPEAPVPVVRLRRESLRLGGAGNVAANAAAVGARALLVGVVGDDRPGERLRAEVEARGLASDGLVVERGRQSTVKTRIIAHSQQVVRCDREDDRPIGAAAEEAILAAFHRALGEAEAVVVSDYAKGLLTPRVLAEALTEARGRGLQVVVDPTVPSFPLYQPVTALTPNHHEASAAAQVFGHDDRAVETMGRRLLDRLEAEAVLVTRGEAGMTLVRRDLEPVHIPTVAREVYDVTGAGDTVSTVFTLVLAAGGSMVEAAVLSNHAAGVVVGKVGTATAGPDEILSSLAASPAAD
jgi:D-beta-D-heptose 7-phosphate kinase/D-beta-D-heptose 1-phosphate adenosyltransferase